MLMILISPLLVGGGEGGTWDGAAWEKLKYYEILQYWNKRQNMWASSPNIKLDGFLIGQMMSTVALIA